MPKTFRKRPIFLTFILVFTLVHTPKSNAEIKPSPGKQCLKINLSVVWKDRNYTCVTRNKKLVWNTGYKVPWYQKTSDLNQVTPTTKTENLLPAENCKIKTVNSRLGGISSGFPNKSSLHGLSNVRALALYVDFPDRPGKNINFQEDFQELQKISNYFLAQSYGKLSLRWTSSSQFARMSKNIKDYNLNESTFQTASDDNSVFLQDAISAADKFIDFSDFDLVIIMPPDTATFEDFGSYAGTRSGEIFKIYSAEGQVKNIQTYLPTRKNYGSSLLAGSWGGTLHEIGHELGLVDYYNYRNSSDGRNRGNNGTDATVMHNYDPMSDLWSGTGSELLAWSRFLLGFLPDESIRCVSGLKESFHLITPIESSSGIRSVFYKLDDRRLIAMEFRYPINYDIKLKKDQIGLIVYLVDTSKDSGEGPLRIFLPEGSTDANYPALEPGDSLRFEDTSIQVIDGNSGFLYISVVKS